MKVQFKGVSKTFDCTEPVEQKVFQSGSAVGWAIMFHIHTAISSSEVDELITPGSISELVFTGGDETKPFSITLTGYSAIRACTIRHRDGASSVELQFTKGATTNG